MKTITKPQFIELLKTKPPAAYLQSGNYVDIPPDLALKWFDEHQAYGDTCILETATTVWIGVSADEWSEEMLWRVGGVQ